MLNIYNIAYAYENKSLTVLTIVHFTGQAILKMGKDLATLVLMFTHIILRPNYWEPLILLLSILLNLLIFYKSKESWLCVNFW